MLANTDDMEGSTLENQADGKTSFFYMWHGV